MKDYDHLLADDPAWAERAKAFAAKMRDVHELLAEHEPQAPRHPLPLTVAYHDACHLAHAQQVRSQPRELLRAIPGLELVEPADWEICCGSAGIYNLVKPEPAAELGERKAANLAATGADAIAAGQPRLRDPDRGPPRAAAAALPPDDPARPLDPRRPAHEPALEAAPVQDERAAGHPLRRGARVPRRAARPLRPAPPRAAAGAQASAAPPTRLPRRDEGDPRGRLAASRRRRPDYRDRRVEITGPTDRKLVINALNSGAQGLHGRLRGRELPHLGQPGRGPREPDRRDRGHDRLRLAPRASTTSSTTRSRRCSCARAAGTCPRSTCKVDGETVAGRVHGLRPATSSTTRQRLLRQGQRRRTSTCPRWSTTSRRGCGTTSSSWAEDAARPPAGHDPRDRADRDAARRVPDGRDPLRAARALLRPQRRPLGLHLLDDQVLPRPAGVRAPRPHRREDDRAVHARLHRAARPDLPRARRVRDGRHGGADPLAQGRGGQRAGARRREGRQGARGEGRLRRHLGRAPGRRLHREGRLRRGARRQAQPDRQAAPRRRA